MTDNEAQVTRSHSTKIFTAFFAPSLILLLATLPWIIAQAFDPMIPPDLPATPTFYAAALNARKTATAIADKNDSSRFFILGVSSKNQSVYRCPGEGNKTGLELAQGKAIQIFGWLSDGNGTVWFLVNDDRTSPQEWIRSDSALRLSPPEYRDQLGKTSCKP